MNTKRLIYITVFFIINLSLLTGLGAEEASPPIEDIIHEAEYSIGEEEVSFGREPNEPVNEFLLQVLQECRESAGAKYMPISRLSFVDIVSQIIRLDREFPPDIDKLSDQDRYKVKAELLSGKGIDIFLNTNPFSPLTLSELGVVLKNVTLKVEEAGEELHFPIEIAEEMEGSGRFITKCTLATLLADADFEKALRETYNPPKPPFTKAKFAALLIKVMGLEGSLPQDADMMEDGKLYAIQTDILSMNGIGALVGTNRHDLLRRDELAAILYNFPVEGVIGISNGSGNQGFGLDNAGFEIYDLHVFIDEGPGYEEWIQKVSLEESVQDSRDYTVKFDAGNYASVYFGDDQKGRIPPANSPIKVSYRLYAPLNMDNENDIMLALGKILSVAEAYQPPPSPVIFDFPSPTDGFEDPATHI